MSDIGDRLGSIQEKIEEISKAVSKIDKDFTVHKSQFEAHLQQDEKMYEEFKRMTDILQENTESLKEHIRRTDLLETIVQKMDKRLEPIEIETIKSRAVKEWGKNLTVNIAKIAAAITGTITIWMIIKEFLIKALIQ